MAIDHVYIVVSQTGTVLSRILKLATGAKYNHASVSFDDSLKTMYSFGRLNPYNPFFGGFVRESTRYGTFKRFYNTEAVVISLPVDSETYEDFRRDILKIDVAVDIDVCGKSKNAGKNDKAKERKQHFNRFP